MVMYVKEYTENMNLFANFKRVFSTVTLQKYTKIKNIVKSIKGMPGIKV